MPPDARRKPLPMIFPMNLSPENLDMMVGSLLFVLLLLLVLVGPIVLTVAGVFYIRWPARVWPRVVVYTWSAFVLAFVALDMLGRTRERIDGVDSILSLWHAGGVGSISGLPIAAGLNEVGIAFWLDVIAIAVVVIGRAMRRSR